MSRDLSQIAKERELVAGTEIRYFLFSFTDLFGVMRSKLVPAYAASDMQKTGAGFAGFATHLDMTPAHPDMWAMPDVDSLIQIPWQPELGWIPSDLHMSGEPVAQAPRVILKRIIGQAAAAGYVMKSGVECEYFIIDPDGTKISDLSDTQAKPCYDQLALLRRYDLIREICDAMNGLGWKPYQNDHEDGNGQFEMNWEYADCLTTADRHTFFKFMVKSLSEKHGLRATFMPKPFLGLTGSGCHVHFSLWDKDSDENVFKDPDGDQGLSELAYHFLGGVIHSAEALCAITNPTVNSYKRINAPVTASGATWAPNYISYSGNNRTHMVRTPEDDRFEFRLPDGAANPYLLQAAVLAAGLDGIANKRDPGERLDVDMNAPGVDLTGLRQLPLYLLDALRTFERSDVLRAALGDEFVTSYVKLKVAEWQEYSSQLTTWERERTLDC